MGVGAFGILTQQACRCLRAAGMCLLAAGLMGQTATAGEDRPIDGPRNWRAAGIPGVVFGVAGPREPVVLGEPIRLVIYVHNTGRKPADVAMIAGSDGVLRPAVCFEVRRIVSSLPGP